MNPKTSNYLKKIHAIFTVAVMAMLITLLAACSPAADETASQGNEISNGANPPAATAQVNDQAPTQEPATTGTASLAPTPEPTAEPTQSNTTQQATPVSQQPAPTIADETPTPEPDHEYTLEELRQMIVEMLNEVRVRPNTKGVPITLGNSHVAQIRAEDAATNCLGSKGDEQHLQQQSKWASTENDLPLLYWDSHGIDSATALVLSSDENHHIGTVIMSQVCTQDTPYAAHDLAPVIEEIQQTLPTYGQIEDLQWWGQINGLFHTADTVHVGIALADAPHRGYYIYLMFTQDDPIEWINPPTVEGTVMKASAKVLEEQEWVQLKYIRATRQKVSENPWHPCYRHNQAIVFFVDDLEEGWHDAAYGRRGEWREVERESTKGDNFYAFPTPQNLTQHHVVIPEPEARCLYGHARPFPPADAIFRAKTMYMIESEGGTDWLYRQTDWLYREHEFTIKADLAPILVDSEYGPGMYFVQFQTGSWNYPLLYPIWLGMHPPEDNPYRQP